MAIKYLDGGRITGLSTDAKPDRDTSDATQPALTVEAGSVFIETDTGSKYVHNGTAWIQESFDSISAALGKSGGVTKRQHFVEWFTGKQYEDDRWGRCSSAGTIAFSMSDEIDGGLKMTTTGSETYNNMWLTWNANSSSGTSSPICQYSPTGSVIIDVMKYGAAAGVFNSAGGGFGSEGRGDQATSSGHSDAHHFHRSNLGNFYFRTTQDGATQSGYGVDTGVAFDQNYHCHKIELKPTEAAYTLDGILKGNRTSSLPNTAQAPLYGGQGQPTSQHPILHLLYVEAYNT